MNERGFAVIVLLLLVIVAAEGAAIVLQVDSVRNDAAWLRGRLETAPAVPIQPQPQPVRPLLPDRRPGDTGAVGKSE